MSRNGTWQETNGVDWCNCYVKVAKTALRTSEVWGKTLPLTWFLQWADSLVQLLFFSSKDKLVWKIAWWWLWLLQFRYFHQMSGNFKQPFQSLLWKWWSFENSFSWSGSSTSLHQVGHVASSGTWLCDKKALEQEAIREAAAELRALTLSAPDHQHVGGTWTEPEVQNRQSILLLLLECLITFHRPGRSRGPRPFSSVHPSICPSVW